MKAWWDADHECMRFGLPPLQLAFHYLPAPPPGKPWRTEFDVLMERQQLIEAKLDRLIAVLAAEDGDPGLDLDGNPNPEERDTTQTL